MNKEKIREILTMKLEDLNLKIQLTENIVRMDIKAIEDYAKKSDICLTINEATNISRKLYDVFGICIWLKLDYKTEFEAYTARTTRHDLYYAIRDSIHDYYKNKSIAFLKGNQIKTDIRFYDFPKIKEYQNGNKIYQCTPAQIADLRDTVELIKEVEEWVEEWERDGCVWYQVTIEGYSMPERVRARNNEEVEKQIRTQGYTEKILSIKAVN